jgi:hypothetical protein
MLTKSDFLTFIDSPLHLWAKKHDQLESFPSSPYSQHIAKQGYEVQKLAQQFLKHKVATEYPDAQLSFEETLIDGNFESRIDALVHDNIYDTYDMYEIKSSCSIKKEHEYDVTFQYLIGRTQLNLHKIYLVHVNNKYLKKGEIDLTQFFVVDDVMEIVGKREEEVLARGKRLSTLSPWMIHPLICIASNRLIAAVKASATPTCPKFHLRLMSWDPKTVPVFN